MGRPIPGFLGPGFNPEGHLLNLGPLTVPLRFQGLLISHRGNIRIYTQGDSPKGKGLTFKVGTGTKSKGSVGWRFPGCGYPWGTVVPKSATFVFHPFWFTFSGLGACGTSGVHTCCVPQRRATRWPHQGSGS